MALPLSAIALRDGHRRLLETLHEFRLAIELGEPPDCDTLRGVVAFLRQEVSPFSRREEATLPAGVEREAAAFEHAFLAAEIEGLARAVTRLHEHRIGAQEPPRRDAAAEVLRRVHRVEVALELHVLRSEDAAIADEGTRDLEDTRWTPIRPADSPVAAVPGAGRTAPRRTRSLAPAEIDAVLRRNYWGILATAADRRPYAVPVVYGYDGNALYVATGPGRKLTNLLENPNVCVTIVEVEDAARWRSVVVAGEARPMEDLGERLAAFNILRRQVTRPRMFSVRDATRLASASVLRIIPAELTGRTCDG